MAISIPTSGEAGAQTAAGATAKAFFMVDPTFTAQFPVPPAIPVLVCRYNPKSLTISGGGEWVEAPSARQSGGNPPAQFAKQKPRTMTVQLFVDQFELPSGDVSAELKAIHDWTRPREHIIKRQASAAWLRFQWGAKRYFKCFIESFTVTYTLFSRSGAPLRATVDLTLKEALEPQMGTNPSSGGEGGERSYTVRAGDSLHSIAYQHYGQARLWRGLAAFNGIDDPMRLPTGTVVGIPDVSLVEDLS